LIQRLVFENFKHRPVRTVLSAVAIGVQVTMILTLVGVSRGVLGDMATRSKGTGADVLVRPANSSIIGSSGNMREKVVELIRKEPHVEQATASLVQPIGNFDSIAGIHLDEFNRMSGGLRYIKGGPFQGPDDLVVDEVFARQRKLKVGDKIEFGPTWRVTGIVEQGKLSRTFADIEALQDKYSAHGYVNWIYVKADDPANIPAVIEELKQKLPDNKIYSMEELSSLFSVDSVPLLKRFTNVVIGLAVVVGFLVVGLSMYTAVLERTREIGILKALGASPGYIVGILMRETVLLAIFGTILGIGMTYGSRALMGVFAPSMPQVIVPDWYLAAASISLIGAILGALYPGLKAARQDAIEALAYD
jgi:putative ABC transport system permease protein